MQIHFLNKYDRNNISFLSTIIVVPFQQYYRNTRQHIGFHPFLEQSVPSGEEGGVMVVLAVFVIAVHQVILGAEDEHGRRVLGDGQLRREGVVGAFVQISRIDEYAVAPRVEPAGQEGVGVVEGLLLLAVPVVDMPEQVSVCAEEMRLEAEKEPPLDRRMVVAGEIRIWPDRAACRVPVDEPALRAQVVRDVVVPSRGQRTVQVGHDQVVQLRVPREELAPA